MKFTKNNIESDPTHVIFIHAVFDRLIGQCFGNVPDRPFNDFSFMLVHRIALIRIRAYFHPCLTSSHLAFTSGRSF